MNKPTQILAEEHQHILRAIEGLEKKCRATDSGQNIDKDFFNKAVDFIRNYADKFHHSKEEDILFKELQKDTVKLGCSPIDQMLYEHDLGRGFVKQIQQGLTEDNKEKIIAGATDYIALLREHIDKEDNILYPMADQALNQETQESMLKEFDRVKSQKFPQNTEEKYIALSKELNE